MNRRRSRRRSRGFRKEDRLLEALERMTMMERTCALCEMTMASRLLHRRIAALWLQRSAMDLGATWCIEQLAQDEAPEIRYLVPCAAEAHRSESADGFAGLLDRLSHDPNPNVARAARERIGGSGRRRKSRARSPLQSQSWEEL